jgi:hypothetical protein
MSAVRVVFLLDIDWAGRRWTAATETVEVEIDGETVLYPAGLSIDYEESIDRLSLEPPELGAAFELDLEAAADWAAMRLHGHRWSTATATVRQVIVTDGVPGAVIGLVTGRLRGVEYGDDDRSTGYLRGRVEALASVDTSRLVPYTWRASDTAWPELVDAPLRSGLGTYPARIIGRPGLVRGATDQAVAAAPAIAVEWSLGPVVDTLLIAGHVLTETDVWVTDGTAWDLLAVTTSTDGTGRLVSTVDLTGGGVTVSRDTGTAYWWACSSTTGAGSLALATDHPGLGSVVLALLELSTLSIDRARIAKAVAVLDQIEVHCVITDESASAWDVVSKLLELYPCSVRRGADGIYIEPLDPPTRAEDCAHRLVDGVDGWLDGPMEVIDTDAPSSIEVVWGLDQDSGGWTGLVRLVPDATDDDGDLVADTEAVHGLALDPSGDPIRVEADAIYDPTSARRVALAQLLALPLVQERGTMLLPADRYDVGLGQWVAVESDHLGRTMIGQVIARRWSSGDGVWRLGILVEDRPGR